MRKRLACAAALSLGALALFSAHDAAASSHREAPFITKMPKVDGTDFYMFRSYEAGHQGTATNPNVVLIANYSPLQDAYGGPNYFSLDPNAIYEIHVDNTGDAVEDITFQFRFSNALNTDTAGLPTGVGIVPAGGIGLDIGTGAAKKTISIPFINANVGEPAPAINTTNQNVVRNVRETYTLNVIRGARRSGASTAVTHAAGPAAPGGDSKVFVKPIDFVGTKTFGAADDTGNAAAITAYSAYAAAHVYDVDIPGCTGNDAHARVFVGQRAENFAVLLGNVFDLVNAPPGALLDPAGGSFGNPIGDKNVTSIALEIPANCLQPSNTQPVIGGWTTASIKQARVINPDATYDKPSKEGGAWAQVSRLGFPLVNEVVIGLKDKDKFNSSEPKNDVTNFADYVTHPTLPLVLQILFGAENVAAPTNITNDATSRDDLVGAVLVGVPGVNKFGGTPIASDMIRLNVKTDFSTVDASLPGLAPGPADGQQRLGAALCFVAGNTPDDPKVLTPGNAGCDVHGFPNGRRPGDDVVDIELRVLMGYLRASAGSTIAPNADLPFGDFVPQQPPNYNPHGDGNGGFPYLADPTPGAQAVPAP